MPKKKKAEIVAIETEVLPGLPGMDVVDQTQLTRVIKELNTLYAAKSVETSCTVGEYILGEFFGGNLDNFNQWGGKHKTFGKLIELAQDRENSPLHISASGLWYSVRILEQVSLLPENVAKALPVTHHRMLVPVKDPTLKKELAQRAIDQNIPSRNFQEEVRTAREKARRGKRSKVSPGRPPLPVWMKAINQTVKAVEGVNMNSVTKASVDFYDKDSIKMIIAAADRAIDKIQKIKNKIVEHVE